MEKETIAEYLKRYHCGEQSAVTSRELEIAFDVRGKDFRNIINALRRSGVPIASSGNGYFAMLSIAKLAMLSAVRTTALKSKRVGRDGPHAYAATAQEVRHTIAHMTHRITGISAAIRGLNQSLEEFDTDQERLPLDGGGGP